MEEHSNLVLVTWDFTEKSVFALEHAINIAKVINHDIALINIVKKESEVADTEKSILEAIHDKFENFDHDAYIIGGAVYAGGIRAGLLEFLDKTKDTFERKPLAAFVVCKEVKTPEPVETKEKG